MLKMMIFDP
jgi:hypothetical protein